MPLQETLKANPFYRIFEKQQNNRQQVNLRPVRKRIQLLSALEKKLLQYRHELQESLYKDFKKPFSETAITEIYPVLSEIRHAKANLRNWMRPVSVDNAITFVGTKNSVIRTGKGTCLIISPWNYPVTLTFGPMVSAIAAGNTAIIKPSELTPHTSALMKKIIADLFPEEEMILIEGDKDVSTKLLELPFDHILFTGSEQVGKIVMQAAAQNLTSVTLELGGKSPVYIHHDANIKDAAVKITAAKLVNAGQTCLAPDYILVHNDVKDQLHTALEISFKMFYDKNSNDHQNDFASVIDNKHFERLEKLYPDFKLDPARKDKLLFEPILIKDVQLSDPVMQQEIFGPLVPVISVMNEEEALKIIHGISEPLSIYLFTRNRKLKDHFKNTTRSGSICYNECAVQFLHPGLPFGGIHASGIGRSHGKAGFMAFSEERVIFEQRVGFTLAKLLYPPYGSWKKKLVDLLLKYF